MEIVQGTPYFTGAKHPIKPYPYLNKDVCCDVLIVGGGIDGAIATYTLSCAGLKVMLIDKARFGWGSTAAATALLQYQLDDFANELKAQLTPQQVVQMYRLGASGLQVLENFVHQQGNRCHFFRRPTLVFSQALRDKSAVQKEYEFRKQNNFDVTFLKQKNNPFPFAIEAGIFCPRGGAECEPYELTKQMLYASEKLGAVLLENTTAVSVRPAANKVVVITQYGHTITAKKVVVATGYDTKQFSEQQWCTLHTSYSIVTSPLAGFSWHEKTLLHDTKSPYHYLRLTWDNRIILGGEDTTFKTPVPSASALTKYDCLESYLLQLFPQIKNQYTLDYRFCGLFGTTLNNLGVIGAHECFKNVYYFLGYGANGILNCLYASRWLTDMLSDKPTPFQSLFGVRK